MKYLPVLLFLFAVTVSPLRAETVFFEDEFNGKLADGWSWIREVPEQYRFRNDALEIKMEPNPAGGIRNILVRNAPRKDVGPFIVQLEVDSDKPFSNQYQQVGIYWLKGEEVKFKFVKEFIDGELYVFPGKKPLGAQRVTLRLIVDGNKVTGLFKPDGVEEFQKACEATLPERNDEDDRIAIQCWHGPADGECWTRLERFQILLPKSGDMAIDRPILFDTPEADAIVEKMQIFPPDDPWNTPVDAWPVHPNSDNMLKSIGLDKPLRTNLEMNFVLVPPDQPKVPVKILRYPDESDKGPFPVPDNTPIEGWPAHFTDGNDKKLTKAELEKLFADYQANAAKTDADRHAIVIDPVNMMEYDFWQMTKTPDGWTCSCAAVFNLRKGHDRPMGWTSSDAAGLPLFPAIPRYDEFKNGEIKHALRFTVRKSRRAYVAPATHFASSLTDENLPRMGERFRLKADYDISGFSREAKILLTALKKYGMIVADNGIELGVSISPDDRIPRMHGELRRVKAFDFEVVEAPLDNP